MGALRTAIDFEITRARRGLGAAVRSCPFAQFFDRRARACPGSVHEISGQ